jgi:hypothetical protein
VWPADRETDPSSSGAPVSPVLLVGLVLAGLMAQKLVDIYRGGHYVCPACGARDQGFHSPDCPWSRSR